MSACEKGDLAASTGTNEYRQGLARKAFLTVVATNLNPQ